MGHSVKGTGVACAVVFGLSGCMSDVGESDFVTRMRAPDATLSEAETTPNTTAYASTSTAYDDELNAQSDIIQGLVARNSIVPPDSAFERVTTSVMAANNRAAESKLKAARLRAEAASKNWLPTIGPQISLSSLSSVVANIVVDQVIFDNGRRKGERAFAKADVEVAAVTLAEDTNDRAATALTLYLAVAEGREKASLSETTLEDMTHFEYIMSERVRGGVSDRSDLNIIRQKLAEIRADLEANRETARTNLSELNAMAIDPLTDVRGITKLPVSATDAQPLEVVRAEAEKTRAIAAAAVDRASQLPGVSLTGTLGSNGGIGANAGGTQLGLGTRARLESIKVATETAGRNVFEANENSQRALRSLESRISAKTRQSHEAAGLTQQAKQNLDLFQEQYKAGQRQVMDVVGVYETFARAQTTEVTTKYEAARLRVEMARILGVLADGGQI
jgi:adhesin transport system outer membrane protein